MTNKINIDIIVKYFHPVVAGIETNILETYSKLPKTDYSITIHTSKNTLTQNNILPGNEVIKNLKIKRYVWHWYGFIPSINFRKTDLLCLHNFNIFPHTHILIVVMFLKIFKLTKLKTILIPHGGFTPEWSIFTYITSFLKRTFHLSIGAFLVNNAVDRIRAVSDWEKRELIKYKINPKKIITISNGIEDEAFYDFTKYKNKKYKKIVYDYTPYIIQIGRIYPIKNYETVIKALPLVNSKIHYLILGPIQNDKTYFNMLNLLAKNLGVENRVHFIGTISGMDKYYLIRNSLLMVHMAVWESFCNVVHEAQSQGKVCIVANNTALKLLIKTGINGFLVKTYDFKTLAGKVNYVFKKINSSEIKKISMNNYNKAIKETWQETASKLNILFQNLTARV